MLTSIYQTTRRHITQDSNLNSVVSVSSFPLHGALENFLVIFWHNIHRIFFKSLQHHRLPVDANTADTEVFENLIFYLKSNLKYYK